MLALRAVSSVCLRNGVFCCTIRSRISAQSVRTLLQPLDKLVPTKLGASLIFLQHANYLHGSSVFGGFGGIAAAGAFTCSLSSHEVFLQSEGQAPAKDHLVQWNEEPSPVVFWLRRLWVPLLMVMTIAMGYQYPLSLSINLLLLFWSTKPTPSSIFMWVEQKKLQAAARAQGFGRLKAQLSNATMMTHVKVKDYGVACIAEISSLSQKMLVLGVLGDWWVIYSTSSSIGGFNIGSWFPVFPAQQW